MRRTWGFECPGVPREQGSKRLVRDTRTRVTRMIDDNSTALGKWRTAVAWAAKTTWRDRPLLDGPVTLEVFFRLPKPKRTKDVCPIHKHDLDKLVRAVFDSLTGIVWVDDGQVVELRAAKRYDMAPGLIATVEWDVDTAHALG